VVAVDPDKTTQDNVSIFHLRGDDKGSSVGVVWIGAELTGGGDGSGQ